MRKLRILIADDHEVVRKGLTLVLRQEPDFEVVGEAKNGMEAVQLAGQLKPDLLLLDWKMPELDGLSAASAIRRHSSELRILVLSGAPVEDAVLDTLDAGINGFVHKDISPTNLAQAIRLVAGGQTHISQEVTSALLARAQIGRQSAAALSPREREVLELMATPSTYRQIGAQLNISEETVRTHAKHIMSKLEQPNRTQAVIAALRANIISLD
jgi:NarL family two-component system response regulator LiaR